MNSPGGNCSDFCCLKSASLVHNVLLFSVLAVLLNCSFFMLFNFILCWTKQLHTEHKTLKIKLPALIALSWFIDYVKKNLFNERRSRASFHTWSFCYIVPLKCRVGRTFAESLWDLGSTNPAVREVNMGLSFPCWNSGIGTNFPTPCLSFLKPSCSASICDLWVGKFDPIKSDCSEKIRVFPIEILTGSAEGKESIDQITYSQSILQS